MSKLRAIFFDIDDTLYSTSEFAATARRNAMEAMIGHGLALSIEDAMAELYEVIGEFGSNYPFHYDRLLKRLPESVLPPGNRAIVVAAAVSAYHDTKYRSLFPFRDVPQVLRRIRQGTDLTLGVITDGLELKQAEKLVRLGVVEWLDRRAIFISDQIGIAKPNRKLYQRACDSLGIEPGQAMHVGDHPANDIAPARSIGMKTVRHRWAGSKHAAAECVPPPDFEIGSFHDLIPILSDSFGFTGL